MNTQSFAAQRRPVIRGIAVALTITAGLALSGCASSGGSATSADPTTYSGAAALVPDDVRQSGTIEVATYDGSYAPFISLDDDGNLQGFDIDLVTAIADRLDLNVNFNRVAFETIIPSVQNGRYDMAAAALGDLPERQDAVDFVDAYRTVVGFLVPKGNPAGITADSSLCGLTLYAGVGSVEFGVIENLSAQCVADGDKPITTQSFDDTTTEMTSLAAGRADGAPYDLATATELVNNEFDGLELAPRTFDEAATLSGYGFQKGSPLTEAVQAAINEMIADGSYQQIFADYGLEDTALDQATINAGTDN